MAPHTARWTSTPYSTAAAAAIAAELGLSETVATVLVRRGYDTASAARRFLAADEEWDPFLFAEMESVCGQVLGHVARGSRIVVHGDYDVDGVCSTALLVRALRRLGAAPGWHLPSRVDDGYGLSVATVSRLAAQGVGLLITVDCGITSAVEVDAALEQGLDVVVTDHHRPAERLPPCPIVHPAVSGYPCPDLCATGVAHKLASALLARAGADPGVLDDDLDLVALATVADVVPLVGENRRLVRSGLRELARTRKPGLRALMKVASLDPGSVDSHALGFRLAPRINASGRLARADAALELLLTEDERRAAEIADELDLLNRERQDTETRIMFAAEAARAEQADAPAYVLAGEGWHSGVIGIVASRMVERHHRPCVLIALEGGAGRGSGRGISAYDLHAGLAACARHLSRFGGHRAAAGLEIEASKLDDFRRDFVAHAAASLSPEDLVPVEKVDAVVGAERLGIELAEELGRLAPFGHGNPSPTLLVPAARVSGVRSMGEEGQHSRFTLLGGGARARTLAFRTAAGSLTGLGEGPCDVAVRLELGEWNGLVEPRVVMRALCPTECGECEVLGDERDFWRAFGDALVEGEPPPLHGEPVRSVRDARGVGFAGLAGDLLSSGEGVAVVCADVARRLAGLSQVVPGAAAVSWESLRADPSLVRGYGHLVALDPPLSQDGEELLQRAPSDRAPALAHLAWGQAEVDFALGVAAARHDLRTMLTSLYRELRAAGTASGERLERLLRGEGAYPRSARECARLVRVLLELELAELDHDGDSFELRLLDARPTELERSPTYQASIDALVQARDSVDANQREMVYGDPGERQRRAS
jgi:single-stranded-DNA-specific exonuclease